MLYEHDMGVWMRTSYRENKRTFIILINTHFSVSSSDRCYFLIYLHRLLVYP